MNSIYFNLILFLCIICLPISIFIYIIIKKELEISRMYPDIEIPEIDSSQSLTHSNDNHSLKVKYFKKPKF